MPQDTYMPPLFGAMIAAQRCYFDFWTRALDASSSFRNTASSFRDTESSSSSSLRYQQPPAKEHVQQEQAIGIGEEFLDVSTRRVIGQTTRVRRVVTAAPVERQVDLHDETVIVERRPARDDETGDDALAEREYVMHDVTEVPVINKRTQLREVVVLRKQHRHRAEVIREVVRRADVRVEEPTRVPMVIMPHSDQGNSKDHQEHHQEARHEARHESRHEAQH